VTDIAGARKAVAAAGAVYVVAWLVGLFVAPSAPSATASDATVHAFFVENRSSTLVQALLVHGIAGVALGVFVLGLARALPVRGTARVRTVFLAAGLTAALVSLVQFGLEIALHAGATAGGDAGTTASFFGAVKIADTVKLVLLGVAIAAATRLAAVAGAFPTWVRALGVALLPILVLGGLAFVIDSGVLGAILTLSLFLLLVWVAAVSVGTWRSGARATGPASVQAGPAAGR